VRIALLGRVVGGLLLLVLGIGLRLATRWIVGGGRPAGPRVRRDAVRSIADHERAVGSGHAGMRWTLGIWSRILHPALASSEPLVRLRSPSAPGAPPLRALAD